MLIITRKEGQGIFIGNHSSVHVHKIDAHRIRLSIDTPAGVRVWRSEKFEEQMERTQSRFPTFYRLWKKVYTDAQDREIAGYALESRVDDKYEYDPIDSVEDFCENDNTIQIHIFSSVAEADAYKQGLKDATCGDTGFGVVTQMREGSVIVLVDYFGEFWKDRANDLQITDHTLERYNGATQ